MIRRHKEDVRFTPTHVGNTAATSAVASGASVHPHARGEYHKLCTYLGATIGSPPRTWGIHRCATPRPQYDRFTPTHVGNTTSSSARPPERSVHPHARGEYCCSKRRRPCGSGSPPRTWGIRKIVTSRCFSSTVHPHARGEYVSPSRRACNDSGSPPRTWGIRRRPVRARGQTRFTPTHVGNTSAPPAA